MPNGVKLSRYDLSQLDEGYLAKLPEQQLRLLSAKLLADLKAARAARSESEQQLAPAEQP